jgi:redox-sensitive bicupin YhaK (pirin superfamily)
MKKLIFLQSSQGAHWVGDGFPARTIFTYNDLAHKISPFLLMDYAGPAEFTPNNTSHIRGVDEHPHRGFETVTIVYSGEVVHKDSAGGGGTIGPGEVQWMTAASGLVHEEKHGPNFSTSGGRFEMVQLWVNLPAKHKMDKPRYQGLTNKMIPEVTIDGGKVRVIAGSYNGNKGPAMTFSPIELWDVTLAAGKTATFEITAGQTCTVFLLSGLLKTADGATINEAELGVFETTGTTLQLRAESDSKFLILAGQPLNEPIVGYGPFVMNSEQEIRQAFHDFNNGLMGTMNPIEGSEV